MLTLLQVTPPVQSLGGRIIQVGLLVKLITAASSQATQPLQSRLSIVQVGLLVRRLVVVLRLATPLV